LCTTLAVFGIIANSLSISIFLRSGKKSSFNLTLIGLAVCDSLVCLLQLTKGLMEIVEESAFGLSMSYFLFPFAYIVWNCGMYTTVLLSFKLYSFVCRQKMISRKRVFQAMGVISILSILINLPVFWFTNNRDRNCDYELRLILIIIPNLVFRLIMPMVALIVFSCLTIRKVRQINNQMEELTDGQVSRKVEHALNKKILAIVGFFFCCQTIISILIFSPRKVLTNALIDTFILLNSSMNIMIYCRFDLEFRKEFKKLVCCCFNRNSDENETILSNIISVK